MFLKKVVLEKGSLLVELIIVIGIVVGALGAILGFIAFALVNSGIVQQTNEAVALGEEMMESLRNYRDGVGWEDDYPPGVDYDGLGVLGGVAGDFHLEKSADTPPRWKIVAGSEIIREFERTISFERLWRDTITHNFVASGGYEDSESVEVTVTVSWNERGRSHQIQTVAYFTNWQQL